MNVKSSVIKPFYIGRHFHNNIYYNKFFYQCNKSPRDFLKRKSAIESNRNFKETSISTKEKSFSLDKTKFEITLDDLKNVLDNEKSISIHYLEQILKTNLITGLSYENDNFKYRYLFK